MRGHTSSDGKRLPDVRWSLPFFTVAEQTHKLGANAAEDSITGRALLLLARYIAVYTLLIQLSPSVG